MADIQFSGLGITSMNGSIGNTTISRNKYGYYAKKRLGAPAVTTWLTAARTQYATFSDVWRFAMTDAERSAWYNVSRTFIDDLCMPHKITGFELYMTTNWNLLLVNSPGVTIPPDLFYPSNFQSVILTSTVTATVGIVTSSPAANTFALYMTDNLSPGRMSMNQVYRYVGFYGSNATIPLTLAFNTRFGHPPVTGLKVFCKCVPIDTVSGIRGVPFCASVIIF